MLIRCWAMLPILMLILTGCNSGPAEPKKALVAGTVTLNKNPLADGEVHFVNPGGPPDILPIVAGKISGQVSIGPHKVEVYSYKSEPAPKTATGGVTEVKVNMIAEEFNSKSKIAIDVKAGENKLDLEVTAKK